MADGQPTEPTRYSRLPSFAEAKAARHKARLAGMNPNYWYPLEWSAALGRGKTMEAVFWGESIALYRGEDGRVRAIENRCAHRQIKLTMGHVKGCNLVCLYHGWVYDEAGKLVDMKHDHFGKKLPVLHVRSYPVRERYGLVFVFPGDPEVAKTRDIPRIPELEGPRPWPHAIVRLDCPGHHSMLLENVSDFTHGFLHRKFQPFEGTDLLRCEIVGDRVEVEYNSKIAAGRLQDMFVDRGEGGCNHMLACYEYPYHWSNTDDRIKHFLFTLPTGDASNRHFFIFYLRPGAIRLPGLGPVPRVIADKMMKLTRYTTLQPLLGQDVWVIGHEQQGWERHWDQPQPELSPVVKAFQDLTIRKWSEYLERRASARPDVALASLRAPEPTAEEGPYR